MEGLAPDQAIEPFERLARGRAVIAARAHALGRAWRGLVVADVGDQAGQQALLAACPEPDILVNHNSGPPLRDFRALTREQMRIDLEELWMQTGKTVLFITHSIDEAVLLADRVIVMSPRPGRIEHVYDIALPRPRKRSGVEFGELYERINQSISDEVQSALRREDSLLS